MTSIPERRKADRRKADRRKSEEERKKLREKYCLVVENSNDIIWTFDLASMTYSFVSPAVTHILGYSGDEATGLQMKDVYPPAALQSVVKAFDKLIKGKIPQDRLVMEVEHYKKSGDIVWMEVSSSPIRDDRGKIISLSGVTRDITDRKRAERALRESEEKYRTLLDSAGDAILLADEEGNLLEANKKAEELLGYTKKELLGFNISKIHPQGQLNKIAEAVKKIKQNGSGTLNNAQILKKDGKEVFVDINGKVIEYGGQKVLQGIFRDITERKRMEDDLRKSEERYRGILESIREGYFELDMEGNYTFANEANCRYLGYTKEELIGMNYRRHTSEENARKLNKPYRELYKTGKPIESLELESITKDGKKVVHETSVLLIRNDNGKPVGFRGVSRDVTTRKQAEEELRRREEKMQSIFRAAPIGIGVVVNRVFIDVNNKFCEITGYGKEELVGQNARLVYPLPEDFDYVGTEKYRQIAEKGTSSVETRCRKKDGTIIDVLLSSAPIDLSDLSHGVTFTVLDITARRKMEEDLRQSEEKYRTILKNMQEGYFEVDLAGSLTFVNDAMCANLQYAREELIGMNFSLYTNEKTATELYQVYNEIFKTGVPVNTAGFEFIRKDKTGLFAETSASLIINADGKPIGFRGVSRDVTERKRMEDTLRQSEEKYRTILENMEDGYFELDPAGNFVFFNDSLCRIHGYSREEYLGVNYMQYTDGKNQEKCFRIYNKIYKTGHPDKLYEYEIIRKDGVTRNLESSISLRKDSAGKVIGFRGISRDITERKMAEEVLQHSHEEIIRKNKEIEESRKNIQLTLERLGAAYEELKNTQVKIIQQEKMASIGQLAAGVAHEINNPMSFIASNMGTLDKYIRRLKDYIETQTKLIKSPRAAGAVEKLEKKRKELKLDQIMEDVHMLLKESLDGTERVKKIVQGLNRFSRMDDSDYRNADINECMEQSINIVWNELKYKATLHKDYGKLPVTKCYPEQLGQVFINLLFNAGQAIEKNGEIRIKTWEKDKDIWIAVSDTGCGIEPKNLSKIFEPFFTTKEVGKGTGLGLSISYEIIQRHKGDITFESKAGKGTTFTVRIPVVS